VNVCSRTAPGWGPFLLRSQSFRRTMNTIRLITDRNMSGQNDEETVLFDSRKPKQLKSNIFSSIYENLNNLNQISSV